MTDKGLCIREGDPPTLALIFKTGGKLFPVQIRKSLLF